MSAAHTPGPWRISANEERIYGDLETVVVYELNTNEADHRLLAAAPALLQALKKVPRFLSMAEVCGEYESLEMNPTTLAKYRAELKTFAAELSAALAAAGAA